MSKNVLVNKKEYEELKKDKARIDYLEEVIERGKVKILGREFNPPRPVEPLRLILDSYRLNDRKF